MLPEEGYWRHEEEVAEAHQENGAGHAGVAAAQLIARLLAEKNFPSGKLHLQKSLLVHIILGTPEEARRGPGVPPDDDVAGQDDDERDGEGEHEPEGLRVHGVLLAAEEVALAQDAAVPEGANELSTARDVRPNVCTLVRRQ